MRSAADLAVAPRRTHRRGRDRSPPVPRPRRVRGPPLGVGNRRPSQVVVYDADNGLMAASRAWFMLKWMGHDAVAVLDGGLPRWQAEGLPLDSDLVIRTPAAFIPAPRTDMLAFVEEVEHVRRDPGFRVLDSRGAEGYHGGGVYHDPVRGHIGGAGLADRAETIAEGGSFRPAEELRAHFDALVGSAPVENVIFYCGSGVTAAQNVLAMTIAGLPGSRMYVGSWSEWILDPNHEVEL